MKKSTVTLEVSEDGQVFFEGKLCSISSRGRGYNTVQLALHRLVANAFHGPAPTSKHVCHHKDDNPRNNAADNLCWVTQKENVRLSFKGRKRKLTNKEVLEILSKKPERTESLSDLAKAFGVSMSAIGAIRSGRNWKNGYYNHNHAILN